jgi:putative ABC transport system permease protein
LTPALRATRVAPANVLKAAARGMTAGRERFGLGRILVVSQVALSLVLLVGSLLFVRTLRNLLTLDPGFRQDNTIVASIDLTRDNIPVPQRQEFKRNLLERVRAVPGVDAAADASVVPVSGYGWNEGLWIGGDEKRQAQSRFDRVSPGYFSTMKTGFLDGRDFDSHDTATSPKVAIVNETFARKFLNGENPIGKTFRIDAWVGASSPMYQIVGFVKDAKYEDLREEPRAIVYVAQMQDDHPDNGPQFVIHSSVPPASVTPAIKEAIMQTAPEAIIDFGMMQTQIRDSLLRERLMATLSGFFGALAVVLATIGLYGVISYTVARRTNEIGLRVALGAQRGDVVGMIMREAGAMLAIGLAVGSILTLALSRAASSMLYGLTPHDPVTLILAALALTLVAAAASFIPAHRASSLDPMAALREE